MPSKNMGRLSQDMKREVIAIIGRLKDPKLQGGLLTVTRLDITPDLDVAKVYISVLGHKHGAHDALEALERASGHIRTQVSKKMHVRKAPRFVFIEDDGAAYAAHINTLLKDLGVSQEETEVTPTEEDDM
ncbi:MAG: 30S ribosome-binding factor RbfA [Faecalibacterium sp.]